MYAERTSIPLERSKAEIEKLVTKYGATGFMSAWQQGSSFIAFLMAGKQLKFIMPPVDKKAKDPAQEERRLWRALLLSVKAKLESSASGISSFQYEFMANIVMPDGKILGEHVIPRLAEIEKSGKMPQLLLGM